jgi:hypothetical protein
VASLGPLPGKQLRFRLQQPAGADGFAELVGDDDLAATQEVAKIGLPLANPENS